jgi:RNA-directed DNA polymerase
VSAVCASPAASGSGRGVPADPVRALQHALYRAAKADPGRRFHALYDKVGRRDVMWRAWAAVRSNNGAPGIDKVTLAAVEEYGVARLLDELASELRDKAYRPLPARRVMIPKPGTDEQRPLSIPPVRDRIVQAAAKIVLEPVFEADFLPVSFGFRPKRSAHGALQVLIDECWRGRRWVVETDIADCLDPWSYCSFADFRVQNSPSCRVGISIRRPFLRPVRVRTARSSPRLTFCNTVWREMPSAWMA